MSIKAWRDKADTFLTEVIQDRILRKNIDISVYNWSIEESAKEKWLHVSSNKLGRALHFYRKKMRSIVFNLKNNREFLDGVITHTIDFKTLPYMSPESIHPTLWAPVIERVARKKMRRYTCDERLYYAGRHRCETCGYSEHTVFLDTHEKIFVFCKTCDL